MSWAALRRHGATVFGIGLLIVALYVVQREFRNLSVAEIGESLRATPPLVLLQAAGWTVLAYAVLTVYDRLGSIYAGRAVSYARTALASFCAYTLAHNLGFAAVSGAAVRYRFYAAWGLSPVEIAKVIAFTSLTFGLGGLALGGAVLFWEPEVLPWVGPGEAVPVEAARVVAGLMWGAVLAYVLLSRFLPSFTAFGHRIELPGPRMALAQVALATVDVAVTAMILYALLPEAPGLSFATYLGIYVAAYTAGLAAHVPGGLGVFDGFLLLGLQPYLPAADIVGAILLYRLLYYVAPLFLAGGLFAAFELGRRGGLVRRLRAEARVTGALEVPLLAGLAGLGGVVMLFVGALPVHGSGVKAWAGEQGALASQFAASVLGSLLLVVSYGLLRRLRLAWWAGLALLLAGAGVVVARHDPWWVAAAYAAVAAFLAATGRPFHRDARLTAEPLTLSRVVSLAGGVICGLTLATVAYHGRVAEARWWEVAAMAGAPAPLRFAAGAAGALLLVAVLRLLRPARVAPGPYDEAARARLARLGARVPEVADGVVWAEGGRGGLAFRKHPGVWLGEGDPGGPPEARSAVLWRFRDLCEAEGVTPVLLGVGLGSRRDHEEVGLAPVEMPDGRWLAVPAEQDPRPVLALFAVPPEREAAD